MDRRMPMAQALGFASPSERGAAGASTMQDEPLEAREPAYEPDDGPLTDEQFAAIRAAAAPYLRKGRLHVRSSLFRGHYSAPQTERNRALVLCLPRLRREMIRLRARGEWAWIDRQHGPFGPSVRLPNRNLLVVPGVRMLNVRRRRVAKKIPPQFPIKVRWQEKFRLLLRQRPGRPDPLLRRRSSVPMAE